MRWNSGGPGPIWLLKQERKYQKTSARERQGNGKRQEEPNSDAKRTETRQEKQQHEVNYKSINLNLRETGKTVKYIRRSRDKKTF